MVHPLALAVYQNLLPGTQLVNQLKTEVLSDIKCLIQTVERFKHGRIGGYAMG